MAILHKTSPLMEQMSIDEAYLDLSEQVPPRFSAIKREGRASYQAARAGDYERLRVVEDLARLGLRQEAADAPHAAAVAICTRRYRIGPSVSRRERDLPASTSVTY